MEFNSFLNVDWRKTIAKNILFEREKLNLNQKQLAEHIGKKDSTTISHWENAKGTFNLDVLMTLCELFGKTPNQMLCEDLTTDSSPNGSPPRPLHRSGANGKGISPPPVAQTALVLDVGGVSKATESPPLSTAGDRLEATGDSPPTSKKVKDMERKLLEMMLELQDLKG
jgi:transcriptional regulator with XRE-family HTH domain